MSLNPALVLPYIAQASECQTRATIEQFGTTHESHAFTGQKNAGEVLSIII